MGNVICVKYFPDSQDSWLIIMFV